VLLHLGFSARLHTGAVAAVAVSPDGRYAATLGRAVQVEPIRPTLKASGSERLKLKYEDLLSNRVKIQLAPLQLGDDDGRVVFLFLSVAADAGAAVTPLGYTRCKKYGRARAIAWVNGSGGGGGGRGLHSFTLELNLSNSRTHS
jgi:hypothetical protein